MIKLYLRKMAIPSGILFLIWLPVLFSSRYYMDDLGRSVRGYYEWSPNGRPVTEALFWIFYQGGKVFDVSPLFQVMAVPLMAATSLLALISLKVKIDKFTLISSSLLFLTPLYLENFSYKYDSLSMALSCLLATMSFWLSQNFNEKFKYLLGITLGVMYLSTYQAFISVYLALSIASSLRSDDIASSIKKLIPPAISLCISYLIYSKSIAATFVVGEYNKVHSQITHDPAVLLYNIKTLYTFAYHYLSNFQGVMMSIIIISSILFFLAKSFKHSPAFAVWKLVLVSGMMLCPFIVFLPLQSPVYYPRVFVGLGSTLALLVIINGGSKLYRNAISPILAVYMLSIFTLACSYANASREMDKYESVSLKNIIERIDQSPEKKVVVFGELSKTGVTKSISESNPMIDYMTPVYLKNESWWGKLQLNQYGMDRVYVTDRKERFSLAYALCKKGMINKGFYDYGEYLVVNLSRLKC